MNKHVDKAEFMHEGIAEVICGEGMTDTTLISETLLQTSEATLALVYEQRTANLIALWNAPFHPSGDRNESEIAGVDYGQIANQIKERLGL